jgi:hypothetical protein
MQCPVCKADNAEGPLCRRCRADLALLFEAERQRAWCLTQARRNLREGNNVDAFCHALRVNQIRGDVESRRLVAVTSLLCRYFGQALRYHAAIFET